MRILRLTACLGLALAGTGCTDYLARRDTMTLESGEAVQANIATHVIDPWPANARRINRDMDGERLQHGIERYRNPQTAAGGGALGGGAYGGGASTGASAAPPAPPSAR